MESLIGLVNRIQRACTILGDYGSAEAASALPTLWESLPSVAVVGGQVSLVTFCSFHLSSLFVLTWTLELSYCNVYLCGDFDLESQFGS